MTDTYLHWLPEADHDIDRLYEFLYEKNPPAAMRSMEAIQKGANQLKITPEIGQPMNDELQRRELFIPFGAGAYVLRYRVYDNTLVIIRVWHSKENRS